MRSLPRVHLAGPLECTQHSAVMTSTKFNLKIRLINFESFPLKAHQALKVHVPASGMTAGFQVDLHLV